MQNSLINRVDDLVFNNNGQVVTNSLLVAEKFERNHRDVLSAIDDLIKGLSYSEYAPDRGSAENSATLFSESTYVHPQNKQSYRMYVMNRDGFSLLVMGFTGDKALRFKMDFIRAFNAMEQTLKAQIPQSFSQALKLAYEQSLKIEEQQKQLQFQAPKVLFADSVSASDTCILIGELAKLIKQNGVDMGQQRLFNWLRSNGYLVSRQGLDYNMPTQKSMNLGLFKIKETVITHSDGHTTVSKTPKVTGKGQVYFINKFLGKE